MSKKMPFFAIVFCSITMLFSNASAAWLTFDIIKGLASGLISGVVKVLKTDNTTPVAKNAAKPDMPTDAEILESVEKVETICGKFADQGLPCAVGYGASKLTNGKGKAKDNALADARKKLASSIETVVSLNRTEIYGQSEELEDDNRKQSEGMNIADTTTLRVSNVAVKGSQEYLTVWRYDGETYWATTVVVLNNALFEKALEKGVKGEPLSKQFIAEGLQIIKNIAKKK